MLQAPDGREIGLVPPRGLVRPPGLIAPMPPLKAPRLLDWACPDATDGYRLGAQAGLGVRVSSSAGLSTGGAAPATRAPTWGNPGCTRAVGVATVYWWELLLSSANLASGVHEPRY
jgi:hypothetical protein